MAKYTVSYFPLFGRGEYLRVALTASKARWVDQQISFKDWPKIKPSTPNGFLPLLKQDGVDMVMDQTKACSRYICDAHGLYPDPIKDPDAAYNVE